MKTYTLEEVRAWIKAQPDDRKVRMQEWGYNSPTGCMLVQFGKDEGLEFDATHLSDSRLEATFSSDTEGAVARIEYEGLYITDALFHYGGKGGSVTCWSYASNFGDLKALLK